MTLLVLDEQIASRSLIAALGGRGFTVKTLGDYAVTGRPDPDVVRTIGDRVLEMWVLITMDLSIVEDFPGFDWSRYAIAWITVNEKLRGAAFEHSKNNVAHRHAHTIVQQARGDHFTYSETRYSRSPPGSTAWLRRKL